MPRRKTTVRINGQEYVIAGEEPEEYMHEVAIYVDKKMTEIRRRFDKLSTSMIAVLVAINIADELLKERKSKKPVKNIKQEAEEEKTQEEPKKENISRFNRT